MSLVVCYGRTRSLVCQCVMCHVGPSVSLAVGHVRTCCAVCQCVMCLVGLSVSSVSVSHVRTCSLVCQCDMCHVGPSLSWQDMFSCVSVCHVSCWAISVLCLLLSACVSCFLDSCQSVLKKVTGSQKAALRLIIIGLKKIILSHFFKLLIIKKI